MEKNKLYKIIFNGALKVLGLIVLLVILIVAVKFIFGR